MFKRIFNFFLVIGLFLSGAYAQSGDRHPDTEKYIEKFKTIAIQEMELYGIPASITLAQGILESGNGNSELALKSNNHFGIKCHKEWTGKSVKYDDDAKDECFRKYDTPEESFRDHSEFLKTRDRYSNLFQHKRTDYKSWAKGLKKAGYATNPMYADILISIIERYDLDEFDKKKASEVVTEKAPIQIFKEPASAKYSSARRYTEGIFYVNGLKAVYFQPNESFKDVADRMRIKEDRLNKYNDEPKTTQMEAGMHVFLQPKRNKAQRGKYKVKKGDNVFRIAQDLGVKQSSIRKKNMIPEGEEPAIGEILYLRKSRTVPVQLMSGSNGKSISDIIKTPISEQVKEIMQKEAEESKIEAAAAKVVEENTETIQQDPKKPSQKNANEVSKNNAKREEEQVEETKTDQVIRDKPKHVFKPMVKEDSNKQEDLKVEEKKVEQVEENAVLEDLNVSEEAFSKEDQLKEPTTTVGVEEKTEPKSEGKKYHKVISGDTLYSLARTYGTTVANLREWNNMSDNNIKTGTKIIVGE